MEDTIYMLPFAFCYHIYIVNEILGAIKNRLLDQILPLDVRGMWHLRLTSIWNTCGSRLDLESYRGIFVVYLMLNNRAIFHQAVDIYCACTSSTDTITAHQCLSGWWDSLSRITHSIVDPFRKSSGILSILSWSAWSRNSTIVNWWVL
jgi:hypothetical protein